MIPWLDHKIFGPGLGLKSAGADDVLYWLSGELYAFIPSLGAQLVSVQWTHPRAGSVRTLAGRSFDLFYSERRWGRVRVTWGLLGGPTDADAIQDLLSDLLREHRT